MRVREGGMMVKQLKISKLPSGVLGVVLAIIRMLKSHDS